MPLNNWVKDLKLAAKLRPSLFRAQSSPCEKPQPGRLNQWPLSFRKVRGAISMWVFLKVGAVYTDVLRFAFPFKTILRTPPIIRMDFNWGPI